MSVDEIMGFVSQNSLRSFSEGALAPLKLNRRGEMCVVDFYTQMALEKRGFELRGGTEAEETGDAPVATTTAEACVDALSGHSIIPCYFNIMVSTASSTQTEIHLNTVGTNSTAGTAIAPNPIWKGSTIASTSVAQLDDAGGVTVPAGPVTSTNNLYSNAFRIAADIQELEFVYKPLAPAIGVGPICMYVQCGSATIGPEFCFTLDWIELETIVMD